MHPRNPYKDALNFLALAEVYPLLEPQLVQSHNGVTIDFKDEVSQRRLTEAILYRDFGLKVELPAERLCPPVPNRLNYILWLEDVMAVIIRANPVENQSRVVRGLDIGTGASAIYPLLGCSRHSNWHFTATELDELSLECAFKNVRNNALHERISVVRANPDGNILPLPNSAVDYDFTMCNPPFYSSREEVAQSAEAKELGPNAVCTGADVEMITSGGEVAFVSKMVLESESFRHRCRWFSSMLGKMSSLTHIVELLKSKNIDNYAVTELVQGQTRRWIVAWSYGDIRLPDSIARLSHHHLVNIMPARNTLLQPLTDVKSVERIKPVLSSILYAIDGVSVAEKANDALDVLVSATGNTWSRAARRKKRDTMEVQDVPGEVTLRCRIHCDAGAEVLTLVFEWVSGWDRCLFESFASHVQRKVLGAL